MLLSSFWMVPLLCDVDGLLVGIVDDFAEWMVGEMLLAVFGETAATHMQKDGIFFGIGQFESGIAYLTDGTLAVAF